MPAICITPPTEEPITLTEARLHLKETLVDPGTDAKIMVAVQAARELCENDCRRALMPQTWKITLDTFPRPSMNVGSASWYGPQWGTTPGPLQFMNVDGSTGYEIYLPYPPLQTIDEVSYIDQSGIAQTLDVASAILVDTAAEPARLLPAYSSTWPATQGQANAVSVTFTCGYPSIERVPACAKAWMLTQLGALYELRQAEMAAYRETLIIPKFIDRLLDPLRIRRY